MLLGKALFKATAVRSAGQKKNSTEEPSTFGETSQNNMWNAPENPAPTRSSRRLMGLIFISSEI
jgi:hypothetical protein